MTRTKHVSAVPVGVRASELRVGSETLLVLSYPCSSTRALSNTTLTPAEIEVAQLAVEGLSNAEIATRRRTSVRTVANQMAAILRKLDLTSRRELGVRVQRGELARRA